MPKAFESVIAFRIILSFFFVFCVTKRFNLKQIEKYNFFFVFFFSLILTRFDSSEFLDVLRGKEKKNNEKLEHVEYIESRSRTVR